MSYLLFFTIGYFFIVIGEKAGLPSVDNTTWLCLAILSGCEAIAWRIKK